MGPMNTDGLAALIYVSSAVLVVAGIIVGGMIVGIFLY